MKDSTIVTIFLISALVIVYACAVFNGVNGQVFTVVTNALILIGTGKIIIDQRKK